MLPIVLRFFRVSDIIFGLIGHLGFIAFYLGTAFANDTISMFSGNYELQRESHKTAEKRNDK